MCISTATKAHNISKEYEVKTPQLFIQTGVEKRRLGTTSLVKMLPGGICNSVTQPLGRSGLKKEVDHERTMRKLSSLGKVM